MPDSPCRYDELLHGIAWFEIPQTTTIRVTGGDRTSFLQGFCTNDVARLDSDEGCEVFFTDVKGKVLSHAVALVEDGATLLFGIGGDSEQLVTHLDRYIIREDVALEDLSGQMRWLLLNSAATSELGDDAARQNDAPWMHYRLSIEGEPALIVKSALTASGARLVGVDERAADAVKKRLGDKEAKELSPAAWHSLRIESGWPLIGVDFDDRNLPQEIARDQQAISFTKGCYLGQETVARIDALGHVNRSLCTLVFDGSQAPKAGDSLSAGDAEAGTVTSACWSPALNAPLALAMVRKGCNQVGTKLQAEVGAAQIIETPAVRTCPPDA